ncbi:Uncharacterised protein [Vibrio cholerae]|nr:Uncharacterised protein [Vibrio cholerae]
MAVSAEMPACLTIFSAASAASAANAARISFSRFILVMAAVSMRCTTKANWPSALGEITSPSSPSDCSIIFMEVSNAIVRTNSCSSLPTSLVGASPSLETHTSATSRDWRKRWPISSMRLA